MATVYSCSKSSLQGYFPACWGEGLCCATLGSQQTVPVSVHPCTLGTCPILPWWGSWPLWSPPPPPEQFLLCFLNPGMNLVVVVVGGCLVSHSPHSHCFFQISKLPRATPHTWLCHLCIWLAPSLSWRSLSAPSRRAPALSWHGFPSSRSGRHPGVLWLCGPALETHAGC